MNRASRYPGKRAKRNNILSMKKRVFLGLISQQKIAKKTELETPFRG